MTLPPPHGAGTAIAQNLSAMTIIGEEMRDKWEVRPCKDRLGHVTSYDICLPSEPEDRGIAVIASVYSGEAVANQIADLWNTRSDHKVKK